MPRDLSKMEKDILEVLGLTSEEAAKLTYEELTEKAFNLKNHEEGDAELAAKRRKETALAQQREGMRVHSPP